MHRKKIESKRTKLLTVDASMTGSGSGVEVKADSHVYFIVFNIV